MNWAQRLIVTYFTEVVLVAAAVMIIVMAIIALLLVRDRRLNRDLRATGQALERAAEAKQTLYEEMNHRTKNNLMILGSHVELQATEVDDNAVRRPLEDVSSRLHTLALMHDSLYSGERTAGADVAPSARRRGLARCEKGSLMWPAGERASYERNELRVSGRRDGRHHNCTEAPWRDPCRAQRS